MFWLIFFLWGDGWGLKSPGSDDVFYWLSGRFYHWCGWYGCQLASFEWRSPPAGTRRKLAGREFVVFDTERRWPLVKATWTMTGLPKGIDDSNAIIHQLQNDLRRL